MAEWELYTWMKLLEREHPYLCNYVEPKILWAPAMPQYEIKRAMSRTVLGCRDLYCGPLKKIITELIQQGAEYVAETIRLIYCMSLQRLGVDS